MGTYQISFFALSPAGDGPALAVPDLVGRQLGLARPAVSAVLVRNGPGGPVVAPGCPEGRSGQRVTLGARITAKTDEAAPRTLRLDVLELDGVAVGVVSAEAMEPGVGLLVTGVEVDKPPPRALDLGAMALPQPQGGRPRKTLFAFTPGTRIDTPDGPRAIEMLAPGDLVTTLDNGSQPVRWIGQRHVTRDEMALREDLRPVCLDCGTFGNAAPFVVSPRHRILLNDWRAQVYFGEDQLLIPVQALINGSTVRQILPDGGVTYLHLLFDRHEVIIAEGTLSESFHPGEAGLGALDPAQRQEIEALFPERALERRRAAFALLRMAEARALRLPG
jgi:hypothetical protein